MPVDTRFARRLIKTLPVGRPGLFNPWVENCTHQTPSSTIKSRVERLALHLDCDPRLILVGEAPGYQGCRYSGVAFTSERLLLAGSIPRIPIPRSKLTSRPRPFSEPSATIVWGTLTQLGLADHVILWNALQLHPHKANHAWSNRTPTAEEIALGKPALKLLTKRFPNAKIIAVGKKAEKLLREMGLPAAGCVRHPANGGATAFRAGLESLVDLN